jgi:hypothetical protein
MINEWIKNIDKRQEIFQKEQKEIRAYTLEKMRGNKGIIG